MHFNKFYFDFFYLFITNIDQQIFKNILKFKGIVIVYNQSYIADLTHFIEIKKFCKKNKIKFYILDNYKLALQHDLDGLVLSHNNKTHSHNKIVFKKNFTFVGKVHNQNDYYFKYYQNCSKIILSPVFKNDGRMVFSRFTKLLIVDVNFNAVKEIFFKYFVTAVLSLISF